MIRANSLGSAFGEFVSIFNRFSTTRSWSSSSTQRLKSFQAIVIFCVFIKIVAGRSLYSRGDALRENLSSDINAINMYTNNQSAPKICSFQLDTDAAQLSLTGRITVITKFNSDDLVMRQVILFNKLESRFRNGGFLNTQFVVVFTENSESNLNATLLNSTASDTMTSDSNPTSDSTNDSRMDPIERYPTVYNVTVLKENRMQEGDPNRSPFEGFETHACYVFDPCGRLTYIIYYPWSVIQRPFVKASILSTNYDHPCGKCEVGSNINFF